MNNELRNGWYPIGNAGVDSGQLWIGDPCYVKGWRGVEKSDVEFESHNPVGAFVATNKATSTYAEICEVTVNGPARAGEAGEGVAFSSGHGDGLYQVQAHYRDGIVTEVRIRFDDTQPHSDPYWSDGQDIDDDEDEEDDSPWCDRCGHHEINCHCDDEDQD